MRNIIILILGLLSIITYAQPKQQAEKAFVAALNNILKNIREENQSFKFDGKIIIKNKLAKISKVFCH